MRFACFYGIWADVQRQVVSLDTWFQLESLTNQTTKYGCIQLEAERLKVWIPLVQSAPKLTTSLQLVDNVSAIQLVGASISYFINSAAVHFVNNIEPRSIYDQSPNIARGITPEKHWQSSAIKNDKASASEKRLLAITVF